MNTRTYPAVPRLVGLALIAAVLLFMIPGLARAAGDGEATQRVVNANGLHPASLFDQLPQSIRTKGYITAGVNLSFPPFEHKEGGNIVGFDPDIARVMSKYLGVPVRLKAAPFSTLLPGLKTDRYDILLGGTIVTPERQKLYNFVTYLNTGSGLVVQAGNPQNITDLADLCGKTVVVTQGSLQQKFLTENHKCVKVLALNTDSSGILRVLTGSAAALLTGYPSAVTEAKQEPEKLQALTDLIVQQAPAGIAVPKENLRLARVIQEAVQMVIDDGSYARLTKKYGLGTLAIDKSVINPLHD